jgi:hypothetical protein
MKKTISLIAGALLLATGAKAQVPQVLGIWELDLTSSVLPATFPLASETRSYDLRTDGYLVNLVTRKLTNGHLDFIQVVSKSDGKEYPQYQSVVLANFQIDGTKTRLTQQGDSHQAGVQPRCR